MLNIFYRLQFINDNLRLLEKVVAENVEDVIVTEYRGVKIPSNQVISENQVVMQSMTEDRGEVMTENQGEMVTENQVMRED